MAKRIVIVEDFNTSRQVIKKTLESMGYVVNDAPDGREALKFFDGTEVDLLITDYNMPNMNGAELVEYLRDSEQYKYIPIVMLSTENNKEKQQRAKDAKITVWVKKPFDIVEFKNLIKRILP